MLNHDFRDMLSAFIAEHVEFLLIGAYALAAHGLPRATGDIDLWIRPEPANVVRVRRALVRFGAPLSGISDTVFLKPEMVFQIGVAPRRVDILTAIDGVMFEEAWTERVNMPVDGLVVPTISRRLLLQKQACEREA